jgi:hypothetical protein
MKAIFVVLIAAILLVSCDGQRKLRREAKCHKWGICSVKDSVVIRDTIIPKADSIVIDNSEFWSSILFECDSSGHVLIKQIDSLNAENVRLSTSLKDNRLVQTVYVQGKTVYVPKIIKEKSEVKTQIVTTNVLKWHQSFRLWVANVALLGLLLYICLLVLRKRFKRR